MQATHSARATVRHAFLAAVALLLPPRPVKPSVWAERYRFLPRGQTSMPGPWRNARSPYLVGIMDAVADPNVRWVVVKKCAQAGVSEGFRNVLGWAAAQEPDPFLYVMPTEDAVRKIFKKRVKPMLEDTPALRELVPGDASAVTLGGVLLSNGFALSSAWAGSPQALATDPARFVWFDETDKYPPYAGREADPVSLGSVRTETYQELARLLLSSTPTTRQGVIHAAHEECEIRRTYRVPCPHCGRYQMLSWDRVKWPKPEAVAEGVIPGPGYMARHAARVEMSRPERGAPPGLAWYECVRCDGKITEEDRKEAILHGVWAHESLEVDDNGQVIGEEPEGQRVGFHVTALIVPWIPMHKLAAEKIRAGSNPEKLQHFRNSRLGEVFEDQVARTRSSVLRVKIQEGHPAGIIPRWARYLLGTVDTQQDHFWYVLRAWGYGFRSRLISEGRLESFQAVEDVLLDASYPLEDGGHGRASFVAIDSAYRTEEVYRWCMGDPARRYALRGHGGRGEPKRMIVETNQSYTPRGERAEPDLQVVLRTVDTQKYQDRLAAFIEAAATAPQSWELHEQTSEDYVQQMCSMHKILIRTASAGRAAMRWEPLASGRANHLRDCEVYQVAAADLARIHLLISPEEEAEQAREAEAHRTGGETWVQKGQRPRTGTWLQG